MHSEHIPYHKKEEDMELSCRFDELGIIRIHMAGNLSSDYKEDILDWTESVRSAMRIAKEYDRTKVYCVISLTERIDADLWSLRTLMDLVRHNKDYATRTGVYGANLIIRGFVDIAIKAARRNNMKMFGTREEAERWALTGDRTGAIN